MLQGCLQWDPSDRLTPGQALEHEWIQEGCMPPPQHRMQQPQPQPHTSFNPVPGRIRSGPGDPGWAAGGKANLVGWGNGSSIKQATISQLLSQAGHAAGPLSGGQLTSRQHYDPAGASGNRDADGSGYLTARGHCSGGHSIAASRQSNVHANKGNSPQVDLQPWLHALVPLFSPRLIERSILISLSQIRVLLLFLALVSL